MRYYFVQVKPNVYEVRDKSTASMVNIVDEIKRVFEENRIDKKNTP